jgi:hypothetical protein
MCERRRTEIQCPSRTGFWSSFNSSRHRRPSVTTKDAKPRFRQAGLCRPDEESAGIVIAVGMPLSPWRL